MSWCLQLAWVNLLCFDEAHHATGNHPYALLMKVTSLGCITASMMAHGQDAQTLRDSQCSQCRSFTTTCSLRPDHTSLA